MPRPLVLAAWLAYPFVVWLGLVLGGPRAVGAVLVLALAGRALTLWRRADGSSRRRLLAPAVAVGAPALAALALGEPALLLAAPVLVSLGLLVAFGRTLVQGPPFAETVARLQVPDLSAEEVRYCRTVTVVWCGFFAGNALVSGVLALLGPVAAWALWTGLLSYVAIALLVAVEVAVRSWRFRRYTGGPADGILRRLFPPRSAS